MKFTFGIVTTNSMSDNVAHILHSIEEQNIPDEDYEVLIVGGNVVAHSERLPYVSLMSFDESQKTGWITKKKNIITKHAQFENIVYMHDYIKFQPDWYKGFLKFGNEFDVCMNPIQNSDGSRFRDWTLWPDDLTSLLGPWNSKYLLPYDETRLSKYMYFSGAYWVAKKKVMQEFPLDETLSWGESEDVKWSKQVREKYTFKLNTESSVKLLKQKDRVFNDITPEMLDLLKKDAGIV